MLSVAELPVYPRVCGGTDREMKKRARLAGLSPRVRGNLMRMAANGLVVGSIPACAGEPLAHAAGVGQSIQVYPRVCGGTQIQRGYCC